MTHINPSQDRKSNSIKIKPIMQHNNTKYNILQWNLNGFYKRISELQIIINKYCPEIICLQETNFTNYKKNTLKGYTNYTKIRANAIRASGGISIFIKDSYSSEEILVNTPLESVTISVQLKQKITICNLYLPNQSPFTEANLKNIIQQLPPPFILLGDFNSHNKLWGCITTNTRGKIIETVIDSENLITLNNGKPTHFGTASGTQSAIDLTFTTPSFAPHLSWDTLSHPYGSDHLPIITKLTYRNTEVIQVGKPKWKLNTADWNLYTSLLEQKIDSIEFENPKINNLNEVTQNFTNAILEIANLTIGQTIFSGKKPPVPWWNSHCNEYIKSKKTAFNKFKRTKSQDDFIEFKKRRAQARRTIKDSKTTSWRAYTSSINSKANPKQIWNKIKAFKCINKYDNIQILKNENDTIYSEPSEIANELGSFFSKASSTESYPLDFQRHKCAQEIVPINLCQNHDNTHINSPLTIQEMETSLSSKKSNACGIDNIPTIFLLNLPKNGKLYLLKIFNHIWLEN
ncbi:putative RNA-directed DNA polymerase, partial [Aphis craccivora]